MPSIKLHVVSFSIPFPADYGGAIDVYFKLKALHEAGVSITLHCFQYDRIAAKELEKYCEKVFYYPRNMSPLGLFKKQAFIIESRKSSELINRLLEDQDPILLEGLHTCALLSDTRFKGRTILVRSHNIEHDYYQHLAKVEGKWLKKWYFKQEAKKLAKAEACFYPLATELLGISEKDTSYLQRKYGKGILIPAFHQCETAIGNTPNHGNFAFYHGNLSVGENNEAALFLVREVFSQMNYPLIIAGNAPSKELQEACASFNNVTLESRLSSSQILEKIGEAQINVLPTFQSTGIKLKLLAALFQGKHCLVNSPMISGTGLEKACTIADTAKDFIEAIQKLADLPFESSMSSARAQLLEPFNNLNNAQKIVQLLEK